MMDITRGSLDEITRPASSERWRPGSRVSLTSYSIRNTPTPLQSSLEILLPDDHGFQDEDLEVEEYISPREESKNPDPGISEISREVNHKGNHNDVDDEQTDKNDIESHHEEVMDPKLKEAIEKMQKLDRILAKKVAKEKNVKRERLLLEQKLREELERAKPEGREEAKETAENTVKFLALKPPPKHYEGILTEEEEVCFSPLFATQPIDLKDGTAEHSSDCASEGAGTSRSASTNTYSTNTSRQASGSNKKRNSKSMKAAKNTTKKTDSKDEINFIQRNIQLASDASNVIAMTDDEKRRLEDLLADVEMLADDNKQNEENLHTLQLHSIPGVGYHPDQSDKQALKVIDDKLKELMPLEDFESICSTPREANIHPSIPLTHISELRESLDVMELGEKVLQENQDMRNQQEKLKIIEKELEKLQNRVEMEIVSPSMSNAQLSKLYDDFTDISSRATSETNSIALSSPRTPRGSNPASRSTVDGASPRTVSQSSSVSLAVSTPQQEEVGSALPDDVLRQLLEEAKSEMMGGDKSRLSTVQEESEPEYSTTSRQSWDCMTNRNAHSIIPSLPESIIRDLIKNPRVTSHSLSSSRANSSLSQPSNMSTHRDSLSVASHLSNAESVGDENTPLPDSNFEHTDNGKLADLSPRYATSGGSSCRSVIGIGSTTAKNDEQTFTEMTDNNTDRQKSPCQNHTEDLLNGDVKGPCLTADRMISQTSSSGRNSRSVGRRSKSSTPDEKKQQLSQNTRSPVLDSQVLRPASRKRDPTNERELTQDERELISDLNGSNQRLEIIMQQGSLISVKPQAMLSRTDPHASHSRAASATSTFRSDSQASTNTVISSSDFEYENQEGMKDEFLSKTVPTPPTSGVPSRNRSRRSRPEDISDDGTDNDDMGGGKTFSPPFF